MQGLHDRGCRSSGDFAKSLTAKKIVSPRGRTQWTASMARNIMDNYGIKPRISVRNEMTQSDVISAAVGDLISQDGIKIAQDIVAVYPEMGISMISRKFGLPCGQIKRAKREDKRAREARAMGSAEHGDQAPGRG